MPCYAELLKKANSWRTDKSDDSCNSCNISDTPLLHLLQCYILSTLILSRGDDDENIGVSSSSSLRQPTLVTRVTSVTRHCYTCYNVTFYQHWYYPGVTTDENIGFRRHRHFVNHSCNSCNICYTPLLRCYIVTFYQHWYCSGGGWRTDENIGVSSSSLRQPLL